MSCVTALMKAGYFLPCVREDVNPFLISSMDRWLDYRQEEMTALEHAKGGNELRLRNPSVFERPKILTRQTADSIIVAFDDKNFYYANTLHGTAITDSEYDPRFVLGVLNSKITTWFYRSNTDEEGKAFDQIKIKLLRKLPIPRANKTEQNQIINLVKQVEAAKISDSKADVTKQTSPINEIVCRLYDLTPDEIAIVESSIKGNKV
jgi:adenine-specific DNA-methyltransferase